MIGMKTIRDTRFVPQWIDTGPEIPVPRVEWIQRRYADVPYGPHPLQRFDLYLPNKGEGPWPVVVLVHGGGFCACDKRDWHLYPGFFALERGFALASVNYRLSPEVRFPAPIEDLKQAIHFLHLHQREYSVRCDQLFLYGTSAGGNLVSVAGLQLAATQESVRGVAALCPLLDLNQQWEYLTSLDKADPIRPLLEEAAVQYLGDTPARLARQATQASADTYITPQAPPFYIQHGTLDPAIPVEQILCFAKKLRDAGCMVTVDLLEGAGHAGGGPDFLEEQNVVPILNFFQTCCKEDPR